MALQDTALWRVPAGGGFGEGLGGAAFGVMGGERVRSRRPNPSQSMAHRRPRRQQINECRFV
jgi:hypothetical protein